MPAVRITYPRRWGRPVSSPLIAFTRAPQVTRAREQSVSDGLEVMTTKGPWYRATMTLPGVRVGNRLDADGPHLLQP